MTKHMNKSSLMLRMWPTITNFDFFFFLKSEIDLTIWKSWKPKTLHYLYRLPILVRRAHVWLVRRSEPRWRKERFKSVS